MGSPITLQTQITLDAEKANEAIESFHGHLDAVIEATQGRFTALGGVIEESLGKIGVH